MFAFRFETKMFFLFLLILIGHLSITFEYYSDIGSADNRLRQKIPDLN